MLEEVLAPSTAIWEPILRGTIIYLGVFALMRIVGRRESGQLTTSDLILIVLISEAASIGLGGQTHSIADSLLVVVTVVAWSLAIDAASYRWKWARKVLTPPVRPLIADGILNVQTARKELLTREDVRSELRKQGVEDIREVHLAFVEPDGSISIIKRASRG